MVDSPVYHVEIYLRWLSCIQVRISSSKPVYQQEDTLDIVMLFKQMGHLRSYLVLRRLFKLMLAR